MQHETRTAFGHAGMPHPPDMVHQQLLTMPMQLMQLMQLQPCTCMPMPMLKPSTCMQQQLMQLQQPVLPLKLLRQ